MHDGKRSKNIANLDMNITERLAGTIDNQKLRVQKNYQDYGCWPNTH